VTASTDSTKLSYASVVCSPSNSELFCCLLFRHYHRLLLGRLLRNCFCWFDLPVSIID